MPNNLRRKRLIYQSAHRGCKEVDFMLSEFAKINIPNMSVEELDLYEAFIKEDDLEIYDWLIGRKEMPSIYNHPLILKIKNHKNF